MTPRFSVSQFSTLNRGFDEDLEAFAAGGAEGIGIAEAKLPENGADREPLARFRASGLEATVCLPSLLAILPLPDFPGPEDPAERIEGLASSIRRLARFEPVTVLCLTGPAGDRDAAEARRIVVDGLRELSRVARDEGVRLVLEPIHARWADRFTLVATIPDALDLIDETGEPIDLMFDTWHLWDTPDVLDHIRADARRFGAVHVNDWRADTRGWDDRALPGEGVMDLPAILGAVEEGGFDGWYDLEIFSSESYPDSLLRLPAAELVRRGKAGFLAAWEARRPSAGGP
jgi:sugar phosphate isomerase/epimerase